jgi:hypothetical protein
MTRGITCRSTRTPCSSRPRRGLAQVAGQLQRYAARRPDKEALHAGLEEASMAPPAVDAWSLQVRAQGDAL